MYKSGSGSGSGSVRLECALVDAEKNKPSSKQDTKAWLRCLSQSAWYLVHWLMR